MKMRTKRLIALITSLVMIFSLTACGNNSGNDTTTTTAGTGTTTANNQGGEEDTTAANKEKVTLTYANWNLGTEEENNMERRMVELFNAQSDYIEVVFADNIDYANYVDSLTTLASAGNLPDVFALSSVYEAYANKWLYDITDVAAADDEWELVPQSLRDSVQYGGKAVAVPSALHLYGILQNDEAFEKANVEELPFNPTLEEYEKAIKAVTQPENSIVGIKSAADIVNWIPAVTNDNFGYFTFDGEKYSLDSDDFVNAIKKAVDYNKNGYTWSGLTEAQQANFQGTADYDAWEKAEIATCFDGSWGLGAIGRSIKFDLSYKGMIDGKSILIADYIGVAANCANPEAAMEFMKWMSYGKEGFSNRIDVAIETDTAYFGMPITEDSELIDKFLEFMPVRGIEEAFRDMASAMVEPVKIVPGYAESRWRAQTGLTVDDKENANIGDIIALAVDGKINYADYARQINELANERFNSANDAIK